MRKRTVPIGIGAALAVIAIAAPIVLAPGNTPLAAPAAAPVDAAEQAATIEALKPRTSERPVIAIATFNQATEVSDLLSAYGVLSRADIADLTVVAERDEPVQLYPASLAVEPDETFAAFDTEHPEGADYVVVPAVDPGTDPVVAAWIVAQHEKGARIISVCNGSRLLSTAGLLDDRRATAHWNSVAELRKQHPSMQWVPDRRYVVDDGVMTTTGITASIPAMLALVEAIGGRDTATRVAGDIGVTDWDARHNSSGFELTLEHKKTFIRNTLAFWRHETMGLPLADGVDEIALGLVSDAYSRTQLANVVTLSPGGAPVTTRYGLTLLPDRPAEAANVTAMLPALSADAPATSLDRELPRVEARYGAPTAAIVALVMEYPWSGERRLALR